MLVTKCRLYIILWIYTNTKYLSFFLRRSLVINQVQVGLTGLGFRTMLQICFGCSTAKQKILKEEKVQKIKNIWHFTCYDFTFYDLYAL